MDCITNHVPQHEAEPGKPMTLENARALLLAHEEGRGMSNELLEQAWQFVHGVPYPKGDGMLDHVLHHELRWYPGQWEPELGKIVSYLYANLNDTFFLSKDYQGNSAGESTSVSVVLTRWPKNSSLDISIAISASGYDIEDMYAVSSKINIFKMPHAELKAKDRDWWIDIRIRVQMLVSEYIGDIKEGYSFMELGYSEADERDNGELASIKRSIRRLPNYVGSVDDMLRRIGLVAQPMGDDDPMNSPGED